MRSLLVHVNRIHNLATKNGFVTHETCRRSGKSLTLLSSEDDLQQDGFIERFKFDSTPPRNSLLSRTPSLEDSEYSSLVAIVVANVVDEKDNATSPTMSALHIDSAPSPSAPPDLNDDPAASPAPHGNE